MWMIHLNIILDILSAFPFKCSFSLLNEKEDKNIYFVNDVTVVSIVEH